MADSTTPMTQALRTVDATELVPETLSPPAGIPAAEIKVAEEAAQAVIAKIKDDPEDRTAARQAANTGEETQAKANQDFRLLRASLGKVMDRMKQGGGSRSIPEGLKELRLVMDQINPYPAIQQLKKAKTAGFLSRLLRKTPGIGKILSDIAMRYESVQTQIDAIIQSLESGSDKLLENTLEIESRYKSLKEHQQEIKLAAYQLQVVVKKLGEAKSREQDEEKKQAFAKTITRIMRRLQNLMVTENAFAQFFVTMNTTMDNHETLRESIRATVDLVRPVLENGLALKIAQQDEKAIAQALESTQDYLGNLLVSVADEAMNDSAQVAKVVNQPLARFQDLVKAYKILTSRLDEATQIENKMLASAQQNMAELEMMTSELEKRAQAQESAREAADLSG